MRAMQKWRPIENGLYQRQKNLQSFLDGLCALCPQSLRTEEAELAEERPWEGEGEIKTLELKILEMKQFG